MLLSRPIEHYIGLMWWTHFDLRPIKNLKWAQCKTYGVWYMLLKVKTIKRANFCCIERWGRWNTSYIGRKISSTLPSEWCWSRGTLIDFHISSTWTWKMLSIVLICSLDVYFCNEWHPMRLIEPWEFHRVSFQVILRRESTMGCFLSVMLSAL